MFQPEAARANGESARVVKVSARVTRRVLAWTGRGPLAGLSCIDHESKDRGCVMAGRIRRRLTATKPVNDSLQADRIAVVRMG